MTKAPSASAIAIERARRRRRCTSVSVTLSGSSAMSLPAPSHSRMARSTGPSALDQEHSKEREQIEDRIGEQAARRPRRALALAHAVHAPGECDHDGAGDDRSYAIDHTGVAEQPGRQANRREHEGVEHDLAPRL